jgi:putative oxidoreductase
MNEKVTNERMLQLARIFLRLVLGITFLVSVADRFGFLGPHGAKNVSWGDWSHFVQYVAVLNWFVPKGLISALSVLETVIETVLGVALLVGIYQRTVAWCSAALLLSFALTMSLALGIVAPLSYSVFSAFAAALLLGAVSPARASSRAAVESAVQEESLRHNRSVA